MRFQLTGAWPVGAYLVPAGTILDTADLQWNGVPLPKALPITAMPLDAESEDHIRGQHPTQHHLIPRPRDFAEDRAFDRMIAGRLA